MQNTSLFPALSRFQIPWLPVFSFTTRLQENQHWSDIQNRVLLANTSWSQPRKLPWSIKYSLLLSSLTCSQRKSCKYNILFACGIFFPSISSLQVHKLTFMVVLLATLPFHIFLWHHTFFTHRMISSNKHRWSGICFLATLNSCRNLTLQYTQRVEVFLTYS